MSASAPLPVRLDRPVDPARDHVLGDPGADLTLVEYGSYACPHCHAAHEVVAELRDRLGARLRYVFRQRPIRAEAARPAAELAEAAGLAGDRFWQAHDLLMRRGPSFAPGELDAIARELGLPPREGGAGPWEAAAARVREDVESARRSGVHLTPTFFIGGRRYEGPWDASSLTEALLGSLGHRLHAATVDFARWAPSTGLLLLAATALAVAIASSPAGAAFTAGWQAPLGLSLGGHAFALPLVQWVNDGLLTLFFLVVGLEIKRELTVGRLARWRAAALPMAAAIGGMAAPAALYLLVVPAGPLAAGWGTTISTDTAFAVAILVLLGDRVPVDLRVFLTAAVIVDDLVAIAVVALFYSGAVSVPWLLAAAVVTALLAGLNRASISAAPPYAGLGVLLWACLHAAGLHPTLAGVILAVVTPTRPPPDLRALTGQAQAVLEAELRRAREGVLRHGPSEPALRALDAIHDRIESPASKLLRTLDPWASYAVLPVFALANAGVAWVPGALDGRGRLVAAIVLGLVAGKPLGMVVAARLAVRAGLAVKPASYAWRQLAGAGALAGIGFTMSLFIAGQAFPDPADFRAAKIAIFAASLLAGVLGALVLWPRRAAEAAADEVPAPEGSEVDAASG
ncbi:Na+/H+ antiporter NhaA [Anaeromyxobacter sp. Red801]|uniref:Na+/H+ antiporter NhaA n=1 Tax=Anaeromyxobacter sp. Red801 TaxID=3411632 RepID=UPI003B9FD1FF